MLDSILYAVYRDLRLHSFKVYRTEQYSCYEIYSSSFCSFPSRTPSTSDSFQWIAYSPSTLIHRSSPPNPEYYVHCVRYFSFSYFYFRSTSYVSSIDECLNLIRLANGGKVLMAVVSEDFSVSYFTLSDVSSTSSSDYYNSAVV